MPNAGHCQRCGAALLSYAPEKLCPACMLQGVLDTPAGPAPSTIQIDPGTHEPEQETPGFIGGYQILEELGRGGMGVVYLAEQKAPVRRRVALKVIKLGMDTKQVIGRFETERQALALMDHSNIAKVLHAGATDNGRPYFVMELVRGPKITDYCDQNALSTEERLKLFMQVCHAVQHAHQKGVIHRDIKPSNILVSVQDGVPVPKIIDFGIAKATGQSLTDKTVFTAFEQIIGTPAYMSPEQAEMGRLDIDTRTDIYSLGVLLYELLTGRPPFETKDLLRAGLDAMRRMIREEEPPRPSTRLTSLTNEELTQVAKCRQAEPLKLINLVRGDLEWIAMKALEKERARRYDTANGLATDVGRYLHDEAIVARPPSHLYLLGKLLRRNRQSLISASAILLFIGLVAHVVWPPVKVRLKDYLAKVALDRLVLEPPPWLDGEEMRYDFKRQGNRIATAELTVRMGQTNGQKIWRLVENLHSGLGGHYRVLVDVQADTFAPIHSLTDDGVKAVNTTFRSDHTETTTSGNPEVKKVPLDGRIFDKFEIDQLLRRLPLAPGYKISLRLMDHSAAEIVPRDVEVIGREMVTVPLGTYECFKLKPFDGYTYWYSTDQHHYLVKEEQGGLVVELCAVRQSTNIMLQPPPWLDGEEMQLVVKRAGVMVATQRLAAVAGEANGQRIWRLIEDSTDGGVRSQVEAEADTFTAIHSRYELGGTTKNTTYYLDHAELKSSGATEGRIIDLDGPVFDVEELEQLVRRLPLEIGYKIGLPLFIDNPNRGSADVIVWDLEVSGVEAITVPFGTFQCFRLDFGIHTYWYSTDQHHYLVKHLIKLESGSTVWELTAVRDRTNIENEARQPNKGGK